MSTKNKLDQIEKYVIYPAVGISRVGNSNEWYYSPELPGQVADPRVPNNMNASKKDIQYKDAAGAIKKQAARFRVYGLDKNGTVVTEINSDLNQEGLNVKVNWSVHLANRKGAWYEFTNPMDLNLNAKEQGNTKELALSVTHKNNSYGGVPYGLHPKREKLLIDAGVASISGLNSKSAPLDKGTFMGNNVNLGELRTDNKGRLIVLGGSGLAKSAIPNNPVHHFANNDGWYDDTSDGPVRATITIEQNGKSQNFDAEAAFVAVVPPNYGQGLYGTITMYDIVKDLYARRKEGGISINDEPSFEEDIWPILKSISDSQWVSEGLYMLFGQGSPSNFTDPKIYEQLVSKNPSTETIKKKIFNWFRNPSTDKFEPTQIPSNYGDALRDFSDQPNENLWVTRTQYSYLEKWSRGYFIAPKYNLLNSNFPLKEETTLDPIEDQDIFIQPYLLTKAALQECLGGPFRPGIEVSWPFRVDQMWKPASPGELAAFRLNVVSQINEDNPDFISDDYGPVLSPEKAMAKQGPVHYSGPGTLTRWMGVPWQADAASCLGGLDESNYLPVPALWAPRAPQHVISEQSYEGMNSEKNGTFQKTKQFNYRQFWLRDLDNSDTLSRLNDMAKEWSDLGIISAKELDSKNLNDEIPKIVWVEQQRSKAYTNWDPTYLQLQVAEGKITPDEAIKIEKQERESYRQSIERTENANAPRKIYGRLER
ncbi:MULTISPECIES: LodA/GoxA family CTQ-dependent oxidase [unclassified Tenacibaculum]|uniref:LodA/GoxA family CTQ-dependent oxidase n=1 Tax=unclassified Tenacibaculum TaxID=2635139 RepID=UPI001F1D6761|nr:MULTISPECIES: LodA/GoxA family CTQ-dependent oxidase [unclassified Tenacibaculum]MCF2873104.1 LodA/GoxA family CTQ-dependent oxidase [Tenacibaculum sp. Cn5-1]MCF2933260.1 LodA/GoxA family CTQ-dependent oxidase [Tenacibaculum sp. Cn5-34]MCG7510159.1 LodA/GoxA family CTQ-dependent oxidase [Tenacibaculum sp. Cn5-46]